MDDDGSHGSDGFGISQEGNSLIESSEASIASASAATTHGTLSNPLSPKYDAAPAGREVPTVPSTEVLPLLLKHQLQHRGVRLMLPCKAISSHIAGTGTFMVMYQRWLEGGFDGWLTGPKVVMPMCQLARSTRLYVYPYGADTTTPYTTPRTADVARCRPGYQELAPAEQELMLHEAYQAALGVCNAMVPGNGLELMDALMETTDLYRKRYGLKKIIFNLNRDAEASAATGPNGEGGDAAPSSTSEGELVQITPTLQILGGSFWLRKDRYFRGRRSSFTQLARSQRARVVKATYELLQAVGEEFSPGTRLHLLDRVFEHHAELRYVGAVNSPLTNCSVN